MKTENGITLIILVVTILIIGILGLTVFYSLDGFDSEIEDDVLIAELKTVHHIVLQEYNKRLTLGDDDYIGDETTNIATYNSKLGNKLSEDNTYYKLTPENLKEIGAKNASSNYLVCYETGEVANITEYKTTTGEILYTK